MFVLADLCVCVCVCACVSISVMAWRLFVRWAGWRGEDLDCRAAGGGSTDGGAPHGRVRLGRHPHTVVRAPRSETSLNLHGSSLLWW
jgi:hypothetical protein